MENSSNHSNVTERIRRFDGTPIGACYAAPFMHCPQKSLTKLYGNNTISPYDRLSATPELIILPLTGNILMHFLQMPETYSDLQHENVRLAINYAALRQGGAALREAARHFSFWLYDLAPPGTCWKNIADFPFSGIVLTDDFFNDNYLKFSFPFLLQSCRETEAEVILRTSRLTLSADNYSELHLSGWQEQRTSTVLFEG